MSNHALTMKFERLSRTAKIWKKIFHETPNPTPFLSYDWFYTLCHNLSHSDPEVMVFYKDDQPVGIIPAIIDDNTLRLIGDEQITDLNGIIYLPGYENNIIQTLASFISDKDLHIDLYPLEAEGPLLLYLPEFLANLIIEKADFCPILPLSDSWEEYLTNINSKLRHELKRKLKKVANTKMKEIKPEKIEILFKLMTASDNNKQEFLRPEIREFFKAIAISFFKNHWLRFRGTFIDSQPIGVIFAFHFRDRVYLYNTGFDPNFCHLSPGINTIGLDIKSAIDEGFKYYDFLRGEEKYKFNFGAKQRYTMRIKK